MKLGEVNEDIQKVRGDVEDTRLRAEKQRDRELRVNNIVIYNIEENCSEDREEWFKNEHSLCMQLFNTVMGVGLKDQDILRKIRLGPTLELKD